MKAKVQEDVKLSLLDELKKAEEYFKKLEAKKDDES